ncbi:MAG: sll1863 family stress response protein [Methylophilaceae bacterium]|jgi:DnaJ-domain-containing protein 1
MSLKDTYIEKLKVQLDEWSADIDVLEAKAKQADAALKSKYHEKIEELKYQKALAQGRISELQGAAEEAWEEIKNGGEVVWATIKQTFSDAKSKFDK